MEFHPAETFPQRSFPGYTGLLATVVTHRLVQFPARNTRRRAKGERDMNALARDPGGEEGGCVPGEYDSTECAQLA